MASVAAAVLSAHIGDGGVGALGLHFQRGDQRIFGVDRDAVGFAFGHQADGVMGRHLLNLPPRSIVIAPALVMPVASSTRRFVMPAKAGIEQSRVAQKLLTAVTTGSPGPAGR